MKYEDLSEKIIQCAFEVINELGSGFLESVYEKSMIAVLEEKGLSVFAQFPIKVYFKKKSSFYLNHLLYNESLKLMQ